MIKFWKEEIEKIIEEIKAKSESDSVIIATSNKIALRELEALFTETDIEIMELSEHLVGREHNDKCYIIPKIKKQIEVIYEGK